MAKLSDNLQQQLYVALTGSKAAGAMAVVTVVSALCGASRKTSRSWHRALQRRGWVSAVDRDIGSGAPPTRTADGVVR
eukprot:5389892-Lingulodinium_polyedra.AAC.1